MNPAVADAPVRPMPMRRRIIRAHVITAIVYVRSLIASWFFIRTLFMNINGAACLRERPYDLPKVPYWPLTRLKWYYLRGMWALKDDGNHDEKIEAKFLDTLGKIERHVEATCQVQTKEYPLPEYDWKNGSPDDFWEKFVKTPQPVVLRGYALQTEAVKKWNFDYIVDKCAEVEVALTGPESDWIGKLKEVRDPKIYCANSDAPFKKFPELAGDLSIPKLQPYLRRRNTWNQFFIGQKATGSGYHCAGIWNFFFMVEGRKKWTFVDPELTWMIYPNIASSALAYASLVMFPDRADHDTYRLYKYAPRYSVTLEPGDVLFNPPWWWHTVDNLTPTSVAVATRWDAMGRDFSFYEINRVLSIAAIFNPRFPKFLKNYLKTHVGRGRHVVAAGAGAFDEDVVVESDQKARQQNTYHGFMMHKIKQKKKW